jgi:hypothetical protein
MADKQQKNNVAPEKQMPSNVVPMAANKCTAEFCKAKPERGGFCGEHFAWFKEGLVTLEGFKAKDFDKKYHAMMRRKSA